MKHLLLQLIACLHYPSRLRLQIADVDLTLKKISEAKALVQEYISTPGAVEHIELLRNMMLVICSNEIVTQMHRTTLTSRLALYQATKVKYDYGAVDYAGVEASFAQAMQALAEEGIK